MDLFKREMGYDEYEEAVEVLARQFMSIRPDLDKIIAASGWLRVGSSDVYRRGDSLGTLKQVMTWLSDGKSSGPVAVAKAEPSCVCVFIINKEGGIAAIKSHKRNGLCGFLGGMVDPGETVEQAAVREAEEEGGIRVTSTRILGAAQDGHRLCALVLAESWEGELKSSEEGPVFWAQPEQLTGLQAAFPTWNTWALCTVSESVGTK